MAKVPFVASIMYSEEQIKEKVVQLAQQIDQHFEGQKIVVVGILKGSFIFMADLVRKLNVEHVCDFMAISSYGSSTSSSGNVKIIMDLRQGLPLPLSFPFSPLLPSLPSPDPLCLFLSSDIVGAHVLIVEDIVDSGLTLHSLIAMLEARGAASVTACVLLRKHGRAKVEVPVRFIGFDIPDEFIVGYGLDVGEKFRTLPHIGIINFRDE